VLDNEGDAAGGGAPSIKRQDSNIAPFKASPPEIQARVDPAIEHAIVRAEIVGSDYCSALGIEARTSAPVLALCRELLAAGLDPDAAVEAYRAGTLALRVRSIGEGALLTVEENRFGTPVLRRWRDRDAGVGAASPVRQTGAADTGYLAGASPLLARGGR
jgi:hypothetical protein